MNLSIQTLVAASQVLSRNYRILDTDEFADMPVERQDLFFHATLKVWMSFEKAPWDHYIGDPIKQFELVARCT